MKIRISLLARLTCVALVLFAMAGSPARAQADSAPQPTSDDLVQALTPGAAPKFRGLRLTTEPPAGQQPDKAPAVALNIPFKVNSAELGSDAAEIVHRLAT